MRWDQNLGYLYHQKPKSDDVDDLSKAGIDTDSVKKLNEAGIWNFRQLFSLSDEMRQKLQSFFNIPMMNWGWIGNRFGTKSGPMATAGAAGTAMVAALGTDRAQKEAEATAHVSSLKETGTAGAASLASTAVEKASISGAVVFADEEKEGYVSYEADWGWRWKSRPPESEIDDLTLVNGIGPSIQKWLNENGIWSFKQLAQWPKYHSPSSPHAASPHTVRTTPTPVIKPSAKTAAHPSGLAEKRCSHPPEIQKRTAALMPQGIASI
jgi:predicted flap endonuclease-1-like 5' DNA nuclease